MAVFFWPVICIITAVFTAFPWLVICWGLHWLNWRNLLAQCAFGGIIGVALGVAFGGKIELTALREPGAALFVVPFLVAGCAGGAVYRLLVAEK